MILLVFIYSKLGMQCPHCLCTSTPEKEGLHLKTTSLILFKKGGVSKVEERMCNSHEVNFCSDCQICTPKIIPCKCTLKTNMNIIVCFSHQHFPAVCIACTVAKYIFFLYKLLLFVYFQIPTCAFLCSCFQMFICESENLCSWLQYNL